MPSKKGRKSIQQIWETISSTLVHFVERVFFKLGVTIARNPWRTVIVTWAFVILSSIGLLKFHLEKNPMKLWVPPESDFYHDTTWYVDNFGTGFRFQKVLITANNVLDPEILFKTYEISNQIQSIEISHLNKSYSLEDLCFKVPVVNFFTSNRKTRSVDHVGGKTNQTMDTKNYLNEFSDPTLWVDDEFYCGFLESFPITCLQENILDIWKSNLNVLKNLTHNDILKKVNNVKSNPISGHPMDYTKLLGGVTRDEKGDVVSAKSLLITYYTYVNMTAVDMNEVGNLVGTEDWVSIPLAIWERKYLNLLESLARNASNLKIYYEAGISFADVSGQAMFNDLDKLFIGIFLMFVYVLLALSKFNWLEIRSTLGGIGMFCVGMAYVSAVSWCSIIGIPFGPVHSSLPFLLMGLGIDDMFVMDACWHNLSDTEKEKTLPVKIGLMLKHAGVSIVITSFTDIVALLIGAITILPSLKSFCIYAAVGVFFIFCYSVTFYVAIFTLDVLRIQSNRNGIMFCYKHKQKINISEQKSLFQKLFASFYKNVIFTVPGKAIVILTTVIVTGFSIHSIFKLEQRFDPKWFIPYDTYYKHYLDIHEFYYPEEGNSGMVFLGKIDYKNDFLQVHNMVQDLKSQIYIKEVDAWVDSFYGYVLKNYKHDLKNSSSTTDSQFVSYLSRFLFSPIGGRYQVNFKFTDSLRCGHTVPNITASYIQFAFNKFLGPEEYIPAMNHAKQIIKNAPITTGDGYRGVWAKVFANWVTDEIISVEVERNIELALLCVMVCTVILITNLQMCVWIFICVLLTILNVLGWMQKWGMTVDIVCCIGLELAIGLCVDYAAHVGHTFLTTQGESRNERAFKTVTSIGTAVLLGGGSTFLSLSLLSASKAYTFQSFFKIFLLVIIFGLFNGLVFLPVILSLVGPSAYQSEIIKYDLDAVELNGTKALEIEKDER